MKGTKTIVWGKARQGKAGSERMLHKDSYRKGTVEEKKISGRESQGVDAKTNWLVVNRQS
jgi:hypothetical protein